MITIAVTGGMGAGKSETAKAFETLGATVIYADEVAHRAYAKGAPAYEAVRVAFGGEILTDVGEIDRARLGAMVFAEPQRRRRLEAIVWPATRKLIACQIEQLRGAGCTAAALEAAVLYEAGWDDLADVVVTVEASEQTRMQRIRDRTGMSAAQIRQRFAAQLPSQARVNRADYSVMNDGSRAELAAEVARIWNHISAESTQGD